METQLEERLNEAILKDKLLDIIIADDLPKTSPDLGKQLSIDSRKIKLLLEEMKERGHVTLEKLTSDLAYIIRITSAGRMFHKNLGYEKEETKVIINNLMPEVYKYLSKKKLEECFSWEDLVNAIGIPNEIAEILNIKLYTDEYIQRYAAGQIEQEQWIEVTKKFKLFYSGVDVNQKQQDIERYKLEVFRVFKEHNIGDEVVWESIAEKAGVPNELRDDLKNILYHQGYMNKTTSAKGMGDLVRGDFSIVAAMYDLENANPMLSMSKNFSDNKGTIIERAKIINSTVINQPERLDVAYSQKQKSITHDNKHKKITAKMILLSSWDIVSKNPLIATVIATVIATLILKFYHVI